MNPDSIEPFVSATLSVFSKMLSLELAPQAPLVRSSRSPHYDVTGMVGLTGKTTGIVALSLPQDFALTITERLIAEHRTEIDADVVDAIGELTNMIAGAAKARLESLQLSLGLPTVIIGRDSRIAYPSRCTPVSLPFASPLGPLLVEVGILL